MDRIITFRGQTIDDRTVYGDLIHLEGKPYNFIQNEKGGNEPVVNGSVEIYIGKFWVPIKELSDLNIEFPVND